MQANSTMVSVKVGKIHRLGQSSEIESQLLKIVAWWQEQLIDKRCVTAQLHVAGYGTFFTAPLHTLQISPIGYYPPSDTVEYTEDSPPSSANELTRLCNDWENSAELPEGCKTRLVKLRIGVVMGRSGGIIQQSIWPFWLGLGGKHM